MSNSRLETEIKRNIQTFSADDLSLEYGIVINENQSVYDEVNQKLFPTIHDWIDDYLNDTGLSFEKFQSPYSFDDEY